MMQQQMQEQLKHVGDGLSIAVVSAALMDWITPLAAALTVIWTLIRIYETATVQAWVSKWRKRHEKKSD